MRVVVEVGERAFLDQVAPGDAVVPLRRRQPQRVAGLGDHDGNREPGVGRGAQLVGVETDAGRLVLPPTGQSRAAE